MNNDDTAGRRARLRALRERYEPPSQQQPGPVAAPITPADRAAFTPTPGGRRDQAGPGQGGERGHLLQRLVQFLTEITPGDQPVPGVPVGEQRLQQAMRLLETRARTTQGGAGERIQRLLRFLTQNVPGEPMVAGANIRRLQQLLERAGVALSPPGDSAPERAASASEHRPPSDVRQAAPVSITSPATVSPAVEPVADEIAEIEEQLGQLQAMIGNLQARLEQVRRGGKAPVNAQPSGTAALPVSRSPEPAAAPPSSADDWFMEFLE
ncbi:MAG: hypothetical protein WAW42_11460 [Candidatus Competibacteraceae bacterium]